MNGSIYDHAIDITIEAGKIDRHPVHQRSPNHSRWIGKMGKFDLAKATLNPIHVVPDPKQEGHYFAIDGGHRSELARKQYGPGVKLPCKVYSNGRLPTPAEMDELFLVLNADNLAVRASVRFEKAVGAGRQSAVYAKKLIDRMGPKFDAVTGMWRIVERYGEHVAARAVDETLAIWGTKHSVPGAVLTAMAFILARPKGGAAIRSRRARLRREQPKTWLLGAQNDMYRSVGKRDGLQTYIVKRLLGRSVL